MQKSLLTVFTILFITIQTAPAQGLINNGGAITVTSGSHLIISGISGHYVSQTSSAAMALLILAAQ